jgi:Immunoglobulin I-set domain
VAGMGSPNNDAAPATLIKMSLLQVRWYRDTMLLDRNERRIMEQFGQRHRLVLTSLLTEDFANYSCYAENELGKARQFILLSGEKKQQLGHRHRLLLTSLLTEDFANYSC